LQRDIGRVPSPATGALEIIALALEIALPVDNSLASKGPLSAQNVLKAGVAFGISEQDRVKEQVSLT
jgi:hypothetical protein